MTVQTEYKCSSQTRKSRPAGLLYKFCCDMAQKQVMHIVYCADYSGLLQNILDFWQWLNYSKKVRTIGLNNFRNKISDWFLIYFGLHLGFLHFVESCHGLFLYYHISSYFSSRFSKFISPKSARIPRESPGNRHSPP